ncbi:MAG: hypothetical protein M3Q47_07675 [Actinomycetota bacterium]|nr:hypothetical protein [Actinomycetota bacterium]
MIAPGPSFRVGAALPGVRGHTLHYMQWGKLWSTDTPKTPIDTPQVTRTPIDAGPDLAVAVGVATDPTGAVAEYLRSEEIRCSARRSTARTAAAPIGSGLSPPIGRWSRPARGTGVAASSPVRRPRGCAVDQRRRLPRPAVAG